MTVGLLRLDRVGALLVEPRCWSTCEFLRALPEYESVGLPEYESVGRPEYESKRGSGRVFVELYPGVLTKV